MRAFPPSYRHIRFKTVHVHIRVLRLQAGTYLQHPEAVSFLLQDVGSGLRCCIMKLSNNRGTAKKTKL